MTKLSPGYQPAGNTHLRIKRMERTEVDKETAREKWRSVMRRIIHYSENPERLSISEHQNLMDSLYGEKRELEPIINPTWK